MTDKQQDRIYYDFYKIKQELKQENIIVNEDAIQIPDGYIFKQCQTNGKEKLFLNQYCGIFVELNYGEELNNNNKNYVESNKIIEELPEIFNEHTLEVKQQWRTAQYIYKKSNQLLFDINEWKIYIIQNQDGMHHIFRLFSKIFQIINHLWQNHSQYQINLDLNNFAINSDNKIIIFNQSDVQDKKQIINESEMNYINEFGNFMLEILKDINKFRNEYTAQEKTILNSCCELLQLIFQNKIQNLNQMRIIFYEIITKTFFSYIDENKMYSGSYEIYKNQFKILQNKSNEFSLPKYYKNRNLEFDFKQSQIVEIECQNNITQNKETLKNYLILSQIYTRYKRNYQQSVEYLNKAIELDPYDIDILIGFMIIQIQKRSEKIYSGLRFILIYLSDLFEDYWQVYYLISWLYDRDSLVKQSQEYITKTYQFNNTDPQIISLDATIKLSQNQNEKCEELIEQAIQQNKMSHPIVYYRKGFILDTQNIDGSLEWYNKCLQIDPFYNDVYYQIGYYYGEKNNIEKSIEYFDKCIAMDPYDSTAYSNQYNYGILNDKIKQKHYLEKSIEIDPNNFQGYYSLGLFYRREGNQEEAIKMWKKSIEINSKYPEPYFFIAYELQLRYQIVSSIQYYKKYYQLSNNNNEKSFLQLSLLQKSNKDFESSEIFGLEVIKNDNTNEYIDETLNQLCSYDLENDQFYDDDEW